MDNIYLPKLMTISEIVDETWDIKTFKLSPADNADDTRIEFRAGQFGVFSIFGQGEAPFGMANSPTRNEFIECSIKRAGKVTRAFHELNVGDTVGFRGPYGNGFPIEELNGKNLLFVGGGIGLAPLRSLIWNCLDTRENFGDIAILYGVRSTSDLVYKGELAEWKEMSGVETVLTVDPGGEDDDWKGKVGFVPSILEEMEPSPENTVLVTCGPPIMIKFVLASAAKLGFTPEQIVTTLEMKMKCGLGKCGRCNIGPKYICKDGPVFTYAELKDLPDEY
ncbi:MAG TPA: heterodisulfide reductase subunit F [Candidatus Acetothermia bacterium]|nr:heterodisulfide reductase subunit F [Candidatus Acetothermia bacterium]